MENPSTASELATAQAAKDQELLAALQARKEAGEEPAAIVQEPAPRIYLSRAERRAQVKQYAALLTLSERQAPVVNPTIIPKSARRARKGQRGRLQHA